VDRRYPLTTSLRRNPLLQFAPLVAVQSPGSKRSEEDCLQDFEEGFDLTVCNQGYREIVARTRAMLRREHLRTASQSRYAVGDLRLDVDRHEVTVDGKAVELTPKEFQILRQLMMHPARVFSRDELLNKVWGEHAALEEHTLDVHIHSLRHKIESDPAHPRYVITVRGVGYKLKAGP
jgi:two-component system response regulator RegX3